MISFVGNSTFPSSITNTIKHVHFSNFRRYRDNGGSLKLHDLLSGDMAMMAAVAAATVIGDLGLGFD
ncbi:hypothetical protein TIFTF001_018271 [Ficus carica]|uniref:Uncharacterized protein n=1 Tax=Ficus carica TaxID=3494 RepID=A0AA88AAT1_FICCA|nr:hypothetical protein TIFTF001_018271 [Ficus carica]